MKPDPPIRCRLLIRADGSDQIGNGHVMRMLALAQAWLDRGGFVALACRECPRFVLQQYAREGAQIIPLPSQALSDEARELNQIAVTGGFEAVALDGYSFDVEYQLATRDSRYRLMVVDDCGHLAAYSADVILNQNLGASPSDYRERALQVPVLAGLDYVLLRREFRCLKSPPARSPEPLTFDPQAGSSGPTRILVTLGGTDPQNFSAVVLQALQSATLRFDLQVRLLLGNGDRQRTMLESMLAGCPWLSLWADVADMVDQYRWADLAVVGGGSTNWELCCFGIPRLVITLADNQVAIARGLEQAGAAVNLGDWKTLTSAAISRALIKLLEDRTAQARQRQRSLGLVDGQGADRVVDYLLESIKRLRATRAESQPGT